MVLGGFRSFHVLVTTPRIDLLITEFSVAQWLEHSTSVRKVVGSIPIWNSEFFVCVLLSAHIISFIIYKIAFCEFINS